MQQMTQAQAVQQWPGASALASVTRNHRDPAWDSDNRPTNYRLKDGDPVVLEAATKGHFSAGIFLVPKGTTGRVINARTPRTITGQGTRSLYFANVDVVIDGQKGRIRVPHGVLRVAPPALTR